MWDQLLVEKLEMMLGILLTAILSYGSCRKRYHKISSEMMNDKSKKSVKNE